MEHRVKITMSDGVADVRLVRADKMNALDVDMVQALVAASEKRRTWQLVGPDRGHEPRREAGV